LAIPLTLSAEWSTGGFDLIVMGEKGEGEIDKFVLGQCCRSSLSPRNLSRHDSSLKDASLRGLIASPRNGGLEFDFSVFSKVHEICCPAFDGRTCSIMLFLNWPNTVNWVLHYSIQTTDNMRYATVTSILIAGSRNCANQSEKRIVATFQVNRSFSRATQPNADCAAVVRIPSTCKMRRH